MEYDYSSYMIIVQTILENRVKSDNLEIGDNVSPLPGLKVVFDGYGYNEQTQDFDNRSLESYALFVHKESAKRNFVFPDHETEEVPYGDLIIQRPDEEVCIMVWYDVERNFFNVTPLENALIGETYMTPEIVMQVLSTIYDKNYT